MVRRVICRKNNGFTLIELLGVIVIVGLLSIATFGYIYRLISRAEEDSMRQQERTIEMATESFFQVNRNLLPKAIGDTTTISVMNLYDAKFLKKEILNSAGETCMENSFATVRKEATNRFTYHAYLYCGMDVVPEAERVPTPNILIDFCTISDEEKIVCYENGSHPEITESVSDAHLSINIDGGKEVDDIPLEGYYWSISVQYKGETKEKEIYNSGTLSAHHQTSIHIPKDILKDTDFILKKYLDITNVTKVSIAVVARNERGGLKQTNANIITYHDTTPPVCSSIKGAASSEDDWINKASFDPKKPRTIYTTCDDGDGSGCIRSGFTRSFPNSVQKSVQYVYMQVKDNAGNVSYPDEVSSTTDLCNIDVVDVDNHCKVMVNVDFQEPSITLDAYKRDSNGTKMGTSILNGATKTTKNTVNASATVGYKKYKNLFGDVWMNQANYPYGVIYEVSFEDDLRLYEWKFETNASDITEAQMKNNSSSYNSLSVNNADGVKWTKFVQPNNVNCGTKNTTVSVAFTKDGVRKGKLTVKDRAGNMATFILEAYLDRQIPTIPTVTYKHATSNTSYTQGIWSNEYINSYAKTHDADSKLVSGWSHFVSSYEKQVSATVWNHAVTNQYPKNNTGYSVTDQGSHRLQYQSCSKAGNCSNFSNKDIIRVDTIKPKCTKSGQSKVWINTSRTIVYGCDDDDKNDPDTNGVASLCNTSYSGGSKTFSSTTKTATIPSYTIKDNAGNSTTCPAWTADVYVDTNKPKCTNKGDSTTWTTKARTIYYGCIDDDQIPESGQSTCDPAHSGGSRKFSTTTKTATIDSYRIYDVAGNYRDCPARTADVYVDVTPPSVPGVLLYKWRNNDTAPTSPTSTIYEAGTWSKMKIYSTHSKVDDGIGVGGVYYQYTTTGVTKNASNKTADFRNIEASGVSYIKWRACDKLKNCSNYSAAAKVMIDTNKPKCSVTKSNTYKTTGVTLSFSCSDKTSGVTDCPSKVNGVKDGNYTYQVHDKANNVSDVCSVKVDKLLQRKKRTRTWNDCIKGSHNACHEGWKGWSEWYCSNTYPDNGECNDGMADCQGAGHGYKWVCRHKIWSDCAYHVDTCEGGWNSWSGWSDWSTGISYCNSDSCETQSRYLYY